MVGIQTLRCFYFFLNHLKADISERGSVAMRFLGVQLFAAIAMALASDFLPPGTPRANEMEATDPLV